jgi:hypothetical protein
MKIMHYLLFFLFISFVTAASYNGLHITPEYNVNAIALNIDNNSVTVLSSQNIYNATTTQPECNYRGRYNTINNYAICSSGSSSVYYSLTGGASWNNFSYIPENSSNPLILDYDTTRFIDQYEGLHYYVLGTASEIRIRASNNNFSSYTIASALGQRICMSENGLYRIIISNQFNPDFYLSDNYGVSYSTKTLDSTPTRYTTGCGISSDGKYQYVAYMDSVYLTLTIYNSSDYGSTWNYNFHGSLGAGHTAYGAHIIIADDNL